jgi:two-component system sensor histidine kinase DegS
MLIDIKGLDRVFEKTIQTVDKNRDELYKMGENIRGEYERATKELIAVKEQIAIVIGQVDKLEAEYNRARVLLMEVNRGFNRYTEKEIKGAYDDAHEKQIRLFELREKEKLLRLRRDTLELNLKTMQNTLVHSEKLLSNVSVALRFLTNDLESVSSQIGMINQMQALGLYIIRAQEEERKRVAREIHDGPAQSFANVVMRAEFCIKLLDREPVKVKDELYRIINLVQENLQDVRKIIFDLRPMVLDDLGLVPALKRYIEDYYSENGIFVDLTVSGKEQRLDSSIELTLFRVVQESLTNVRKHANAKEVIIKIEFLPRKINVVIRDNGFGFDIENISSQMKGTGFGLIGMRERIQLLRGKMDIKSVKGLGTEISITVPVVEGTSAIRNIV